MNKTLIDFYTRLAHAIAMQFGPKCEVVVHDLQHADPEHSIIIIENGHVSGRSVGDGFSPIAPEFLWDENKNMEDKLAYLTKTRDGKVLKSSTLYIRDDSGQIIGILGINFDITVLLAAESEMNSLVGMSPSSDIGTQSSRENPPINVSKLLEELIEQSLRSVGKPVELMNKEDKIKFVKYLNDAGAFLITKSGPKVCQYLDISKYTLYSYLDEIKTREAHSK